MLTDTQPRSGPLYTVLTSAHAGFLYERGDYRAALEITRKLVLDTQARTAVATAARLHTETLGWLAAIRRVRDTQYGRAIATYRAHKRCAALPGLRLAN